MADRNVLLALADRCEREEPSWDLTVAIELAVVPGANGDPFALATQAVPNGPLLLGAIDRLVRESVRQLDVVQ